VLFCDVGGVCFEGRGFFKKKGNFFWARVLWGGGGGVLVRPPSV